jgi:hypothetical protein
MPAKRKAKLGDVAPETSSSSEDENEVLDVVSIPKEQPVADEQYPEEEKSDEGDESEEKVQSPHLAHVVMMNYHRLRHSIVDMCPISDGKSADVIMTHHNYYRPSFCTADTRWDPRGRSANVTTITLTRNTNCGNLPPSCFRHRVEHLPVNSNRRQPIVKFKTRLNPFRTCSKPDGTSACPNCVGPPRKITSDFWWSSELRGASTEDPAEWTEYSISAETAAKNLGGLQRRFPPHELEPADSILDRTQLDTFTAGCKIGGFATKQ